MTKDKNVTLTEFFCGGGGMSLGFKQAGVEILKAYDFDKFAVESYKHNVGEHVEQKSVTDLKGEDIPKSDVWTFGFPCFVADTMIITKRGILPIQDVVIGDEVWTHKNRWKKVTNTMSKESSIIELKGENLHQLLTTKEHPFWALENANNKTPSWIEAKDMLNHYWSSPLNIQTKDLYPFTSDYDLNEDILYLIGLWLDYGLIDFNYELEKDTLVFIIENNILNEFSLKLQKNKFDYKVKGEFYLQQMGFSQVEVINDDFFNFILENFIDLDKMKKAPLWILSLDDTLKESFISGLTSRNKYNKKHEIQLINKDYALFIKLLFESLKYNVSLDVHYEHDIEAMMYIINYGKEYFEHEHVVNEQYFKKVYEVNELNNIQMVYNLEVEDDNSYVADTIIVHNCQDISVAGKMKGMIKGETRSGLFYEIMRLLEETKKENKPKIILAENVKQVKHYFEPIKEEFEKQGYTFTYVLYNSKYFNVAQNRERYFMLGVHESIQKEFTFKEHPNNPIPSLSDFLEKNVDEKYYLDVQKAKTIIDDALKKTKELSLDNIHAILNPSRIIMRQNGRRMKNNEEVMFTLTATEVHGVVEKQKEKGIEGVGYLDMKGTQSLRRVYHKDGIAPTLTTAQGGNMQVKILEGENREVPIHEVTDENIYDYYTLRKLTPREYARLQGFPDSYEQIVSNSQFYKQMGNAVTVTVSKYIAEQIIEFLKEDLK